MSEGLSGHSEQRAFNEEVPYTAVEHAGIEVYTPAPSNHAQILLVVDHHRVSLVVIVHDVLEVFLGEECFGSVHNFLEEFVGQVAVSHRPAEVFLSSDDRDMTTLKIASGVTLVGPCQLFVEE